VEGGGSDGGAGLLHLRSLARHPAPAPLDGAPRGRLVQPLPVPADRVARLPRAHPGPRAGTRPGGPARGRGGALGRGERAGRPVHLAGRGDATPAGGRGLGRGGGAGAAARPRAGQLGPRRSARRRRLGALRQRLRAAQPHPHRHQPAPAPIPRWPPGLAAGAPARWALAAAAAGPAPGARGGGDHPGAGAPGALDARLDEAPEEVRASVASLLADLRGDDGGRPDGR
jgi:hypothetical protein